MSLNDLNIHLFTIYTLFNEIQSNLINGLCKNEWDIFIQKYLQILREYRINNISFSAQNSDVINNSYQSQIRSWLRKYTYIYKEWINVYNNTINRTIQGTIFNNYLFYTDKTEDLQIRFIKFKKII